MNERFEDQAAAYLDGTLEETEDFVRELRENPEARRYLLLAAHADVALHDLGQAPRRSRRPFWIAAAAALLLAGVLYWLSGDGVRLTTGPDTVFRGGVLEKGWFTAEVEPREKPFIARTSDAEIRVLGTRFRLSAGPTRLDVETGKVRLTRLADGKSVDVGAGRFALADLELRPLGRIAAPGGTSTGDGSFDRPWDLATAFSSTPPGETLWLRGGVYAGQFRCALKDVEVRGFPGERARVEGGIVATGERSVFRGFEISKGPEGLSMLGRGQKALNLLVHDCAAAGIGFREAVGDGGEISGCVVWGNGLGISAQNAEGRRVLRDNIVFRGRESGIFVFAEKGRADGFELEGNAVFDHPRWNVVATGGEHPLRGFRMRDNAVFGSGFVRVGLLPGSRVADAELRNNTFVLGPGDEGLHLYQGEDVVFAGNTVVGRDVLARWTPAAAGRRDWNRNAYHATVGPGRFLLPSGPLDVAGWKASTSFDAESPLVAAPPERTRVIVRPNAYEPGRAHVIVLNWERKASVELDLPGPWVARDVLDLFGPPAARSPGPLPVPADFAVFVVTRD